MVAEPPPVADKEMPYEVLALIVLPVIVGLNGPPLAVIPVPLRSIVFPVMIGEPEGMLIPAVGFERMMLLLIVGVTAERTIPAVLLLMIVFVLIDAMAPETDMPGLLLLIVFPVMLTVGEPAPTGKLIPVELLLLIVLLPTDTTPAPVIEIPVSLPVMVFLVITGDPSLTVMPAVPAVLPQLIVLLSIVAVPVLIGKWRTRRCSSSW